MDDSPMADDMEVLSASVKLFIEKATNQDWTLRVGWLNQLKKNLSQVPGKYFCLHTTNTNVYDRGGENAFY